MNSDSNPCAEMDLSFREPSLAAKIQYETERILFRRYLEQKLDGYTLSTSLEVTEAILKLLAEEQNRS